jgi:uncharacterized protein YprB with RNaseH-like and TPR domain
MLSDEIRARLAQLSATPPIAPLSPPPRDRRVQQQLWLAPGLQADSAVIGFDLSAAEVQLTASGEHLRIRRPLAELWPAAKAIVPQAIARLSSRAYRSPAGSDQPELHPELAAVAEHFPATTMFLDLETCGFAGAPVFLAGVVWRDGEMLVVDQLFARDYTQERALLETLGTIAAEQRVLATFNGKSFDWPMVCDRSIRHRLHPRLAIPLRKPHAVAEETLVHCDLLHHARRRWKRVLPNCKLQTLERLVCRRVRHDDLGGGEVPTAYHQFVRTGDSTPIEKILLHNALDLVTLVEVTLRLMQPAAESQAPRVAAG